MTRQKFAGTPLSVTIGQRSTVELPPRVFRGRLTGLLFETDKAFLLPSAMNGIRELKRFYDDHPGLQVLVTGHTDTVGPAEYNEQLSNERAAAMAAFLQDDADGWLPHYQGSLHSKVWGTREDQLMLSSLPQGGPPFYAGPLTGFLDPDTEDAVRRYQTQKGLTVDGVAGPETRRALVADYMALDGTTLPAGTTLVTHGCGESHPAVPTLDEVDEPANRRVEIFLFEGDITPAPRTPCHGCPQYPEWVAQTVLTVDFTLDSGWLDVTVVDLGGTLVAGAAVSLAGPVSAAGQTDPSGSVRFADLVPGSYQVTVELDKASDLVFAADVTAGVPPPAVGATPSVDTMPLPPREQLAAASSTQPNAAPAASAGSRQSLVGGAGTSSSLVGASPSAVGDATPGAPAAGAPVAGPSGFNVNAGPNNQVAVVAPLCALVFNELPADLEPSAREGNGAGQAQPWEKSSVEAQLIYQPQLLPAVGPAAKFPYSMPVFASSAAPAGVSALVVVTQADVTNQFTVQRQGPHQRPIIWAMDSQDPVRFDTPSPVTRNLFGRARLSLWADPTFVVDSNLVAGVADDLSLLATVQNLPDRMDFDFDSGMLPNHGRTALRKLFRDVIDRGHAHGMQVLAGYGLVLDGSDRIAQFDDWLFRLSTAADVNAANTEIDGVAQKLVTFVDSIGDATHRFDGISFDIESIGLKPSTLTTAITIGKADFDKMRRVLRRFYQKVAEILARDNRICAITVGGMMSDDMAVLVSRIPILAQKMANNPKVGFSDTLGEPAARLHVYDIAQNVPNIIIRPMAYDNAGGTLSHAPDADEQSVRAKKADFNDFNGDPGQLQWHEAVTRFALEEKKLHPAQFQLGMKRFQPDKLVNGRRIPTGQGGNVTGSNNQDERARLMRKFRAGLALFTLFKSDVEISTQKRWGRIIAMNDILNADAAGQTMPTGRAGIPMQVPLDDAGAQALADAVAAAQGKH